MIVILIGSFFILLNLSAAFALSSLYISKTISTLLADWKRSLILFMIFSVKSPKFLFDLSTATAIVRAWSIKSKTVHDTFGWQCDVVSILVSITFTKSDFIRWASLVKYKDVGVNSNFKSLSIEYPRSRDASIILCTCDVSILMSIVFFFSLYCRTFFPRKWLIC